MESNRRRFISATIVVTLYTLMLVYVLEQISEAPLLVNASSFQWFLGAIVAFVSTSILGGVIVLQGKHEVRKAVVLAGVVMVIVGSPHLVVGDLFRGDFGLDTIVRTLLFNASILSALGIFYLIAFKPAEAEAG